MRETDKYINNVTKVISTNVIRAMRVLQDKNRERIIRPTPLVWEVREAISGEVKS